MKQNYDYILIDCIQDFFFTESPIPVKVLVEKYAMPKTSIYRKRDDAPKALKKILGNA